LSRIKFTPLFLTVLSLCASSFCNVVIFGKEPQKIETSVSFVSSDNTISEELLFLSYDANILWKVNRHTGTIKAFNFRYLFPMWSSSGLVYRVSSTYTQANQQLDAIYSTMSFRQKFSLFDERIEFTEIFGRVYFHLAERNNEDVFSRSHTCACSNDFTDQILAFDPESQGKLLWKLNANELKQILCPSSNALPRFAAAPLKEKENLLIVVLLLDSQSYCLKIDARFGTPVFE